MEVAVADLNADGHADLITGAGTGGGPHMKAFDEASCLEVLSFFAGLEPYGGGIRSPRTAHSAVAAPPSSDWAAR